MAIDQEKDKVIGTSVFYYGIENNKDEYYDIVTRRSIFITYFYVAPSYRNNNIGTSIINNIELLKRYSVNICELQVASKNIKAYELYNRLQYNIISTSYCIYSNFTNVTSANNISFNNHIRDKIIESINSKLIYFNNYNTLHQILNNIIIKIKSNIYEILDIDGNYVIFETSKTRLIVWDIILNEEYNFIKFNKIIKSIQAYANKINLERIDIMNIFNNNINYSKFNLIPFSYTMFKYI